MFCEKITAPLQRLLLQIKTKTLCSKNYNILEAAHR